MGGGVAAPRRTIILDDLRSQSEKRRPSSLVEAGQTVAPLLRGEESPGSTGYDAG